VAAAVATAVVAAVVGGCTGGEDPTIPTAGGTPTATEAGPDPQAQELEFVACMREEGIEDMPDPVPGDTSGRSAVRYALDGLGMGLDPAFQAALDTCLHLLPEPPPREPDSPDEIEAKRQFARCMRENGLAEFPDPQGDNWGFDLVAAGNSVPPQALMIVDGVAFVNLGDPVANAAWETCKELFVTGNG
jgi:hypothetical protein